MFEFMRKALEVKDVDYLEVRVEETCNTSIIYSGKELEYIGETTGRGGCIRALVHGGWGFASFNDLSQIPVMAQRAVAMAKSIGGNGIHLSPIPETTTQAALSQGTDPLSISLEQKHHLATQYNQLLLSHHAIQTSNVRYEDRHKVKYFLSSQETETVLEETFCGVSLSALARDGANVQHYFKSFGNMNGYEEACGHEWEAERICQNAVDALRAERIAAGTYSVLMDPLLSGIFAHEAFGHLSESDFLDENPRLQEIMKLGKPFGPEELTIADDGTLPHAGQIAFDDEGTAARRTDLIRNGKLVGRLHSRETAAKLGEQPTGNARSISYTFPPIVRMTNTFIDCGQFSKESILDEMGEGIYCLGALAGQTNCEMFTFTPMEAYEIRNGTLGKRLRDVVLTGNVFQTLGNIKRIGNDLTFHGGLGGCGKRGQAPLRVSTGGPHVWIEDVVVGGK